MSLSDRVPYFIDSSVTNQYGTSQSKDRVTKMSTAMLASLVLSILSLYLCQSSHWFVKYSRSFAQTR